MGAAFATVFAMGAGVAASMYYLRRLCRVSLGDIYNKPVIAGGLTLVGFVCAKQLIVVVPSGCHAIYFMLMLMVTYSVLLGLLEYREIWSKVRYIFVNLKA